MLGRALRRYDLLSWLFDVRPEILFLRDFGVTTGTLTVLVDNLTKSGLVERVPHDTDRRSILVKLTEQGVKLFEEHDALHLQLTKQLTADFNQEEVQLLNKLMERINRAF